MSDIHTRPTRKIDLTELFRPPTVMVVAGTYAQFRNWQEQDMKTRRAARYVRRWDELRGLHRDSTTVLFLGQYYSRVDIGVISEVVADNGYQTVFESASSTWATR